MCFLTRRVRTRDFTVHDIPRSTNFPVFFYWLLTATALQQPIKSLENWQKVEYQLGIQIFQCIFACHFKSYILMMFSISSKNLSE